MNRDIIIAYRQEKHSLEICCTVSLHELLFGAQEDVGFVPAHREAELTLGITISHMCLCTNPALCTYLTSWLICRSRR